MTVLGAAGLRLRRETGARASNVVVSRLATGIVLALFAIDTARNEPQTFTAMIVLGLLAIVLDFAWKRVRPAAPLPPASPSAR